MSDEEIMAACRYVNADHFIDRLEKGLDEPVRERGNNFSAGLSYYYMLSNLITILQNWVIRKWFIDKDKIYARIQAASVKPTKKSKFQQRIDAMYKAQQQAQQQKYRQ